MIGGAAFASVLLAACGGEEAAPSSGAGATSTPSPTDTATSANAADEASATRVITDAKGEVEVPSNPQRLVILDSTIMHVMALGVAPVGARNVSRDIRHNPEIASQFEGITDFGGGDLDMEQVVVLQPDVILASSPNNDDIYDQLAQIAPTVMYDAGQFIDSAFNWEHRLLFYAEVLGKQERAQELLADYEARIDEFQTSMGDLLQETVVSVITSGRDGISLCAKGGFLGAVLVDADVRRPESQDLFSEEIPDNFGSNPGEIDISFERLQEADGDVLFVWENGSDQEVTENTGAMQAHPLWSQLNVVQQGRVYQVGPHWRGFSIISANKLLDDLFAHLL